MDKRRFCIVLLVAFISSILVLNTLMPSPSVEDSDDFSNDFSSNSVVEPRENKTVLIDDIFISVKTTAKYHESRIKLIVETWFPLARNSTYFFTDVKDVYYNTLTGQHMINSGCGAKHNSMDLVCKMALEMEWYHKFNNKWFCHFDDDNYVHVVNLCDTLRQYDHTKDVYVGRSSTGRPTKAFDVATQSLVTMEFATGGAGFCISRSLMHRMAPFTRDGKLLVMKDRIKLPDDVVIGFIVTHLLKVPLTEVRTFHSHLENLSRMTKAQLRKQVSLSYGTWTIEGKHILNRITVFPHSEADITGIRRVHCYLFPREPGCKRFRIV